MAGIAVGNLALVITVLGLLGLPLPAIIVGSMIGLQATFLVRDEGNRAQALTLVLILLVASVIVVLATLIVGYPFVAEATFCVVIFLAVLAQRFGPRGSALGAVAFFLFFFANFLQFELAHTGPIIGAMAVGLAANALMRFVILPRRPEAELLRVRRGFRARLAGLVDALGRALAARDTPRRRRQLQRRITRLHECALMIEEVLGEEVDPDTEIMLRRRVVEVELAAERLVRAATQIDTTELAEADRADLVIRLDRLHRLIERDPAELPVISHTTEFADMLADQPGRAGSSSWPVRRAIAQLALADADAQRLVQRELDERPPVDIPLSAAEESDPERKSEWLDETTRQALQALVAGALAIVGGELVSTQRWYWAVITVFVVFLGTSSRGTMFVKGFRRLTGTVWGILGGLGAASLVAGSTPAAVALIGVCVFGFVYVMRVSQGLMTFFMTTMLGLLYSLLGTFSFDVLLLRLAETVVGVLAGILAAFVIVPIRTRQATRDQVLTILEELRTFVSQAQDLLSGKENLSLIEQARTVDREVGKLRGLVEPLTHPFNLYRGQRQYGWYIQAALETCAFYARDVAVRAEPGLLSGDERLPVAAHQVLDGLDHVLGELSERPAHQPVARPESTGQGTEDDPTALAVLDDLARLDSSVHGLARALGVTEDDADTDDGADSAGTPSGATDDRVR